MTTITQTITAFATDLPNKGDMTADEFDVAAELWVDHQTGLETELNTFSGQVNTVAGEINQVLVDVEDVADEVGDLYSDTFSVLTQAIATRNICYATANFKGNWSVLTGALAMPATTYHANQWWVLMTDLADVTSSEPDASNSDWLVYTVAQTTEAKTGDYTITTEDCLANKTFTNTGASGSVEISLPPVSVNYRLCFLVTVAQYLKTTADGTETIRYVTEQSAAGGYLRSNVIGTYWVLDGSSGTEWVITELQGNVLVDE